MAVSMFRVDTDLACMYTEPMTHTENVRVTTNGHARPVLQGWDLTDAERASVDYVDWQAVEEGNDSVSFFRYRGELYDLGEFTATLRQSPGWEGWQGYQSESFFSGVVIKFPSDGTDVYGDARYDYDSVIVGTYSM